MSEAHPFRFGVQVSNATAADEWASKVQRAEELGYSTLLMPDHFGDQLAPIPALAAAASLTTSLRVGSFVFDNDFRHPGLLSKEAATIDLLSRGRFELGIGAGWLAADYEQTGIAYDPVGARLERLAEAVQVIKGLLTSTTFTFHGKYYSVDDLAGFPRPIQRPHPPILIGGGGKRVLTLAAQEADIVGLLPRISSSGASRDLADGSVATAEKVEWVRRAAGGRFDRLELNTLIFGMEVGDDRQQAAEHLGSRLGLSAEQVLDTPHLLAGSVEQITDELWEQRKHYRISYVVVREDQMEEFAPVVSRLAGT